MKIATFSMDKQITKSYTETLLDFNFLNLKIIIMSIKEITKGTLCLKNYS